MKELIVNENKFPIRADGLEICYDTQYKIVGEIIRCKDCKYIDKAYPGKYEPNYCKVWQKGNYPDEYCSRGERKTDE